MHAKTPVSSCSKEWYKSWCINSLGLLGIPVSVKKFTKIFFKIFHWHIHLYISINNDKHYLLSTVKWNGGLDSSLLVKEFRTRHENGIPVSVSSTRKICKSPEGRTWYFPSEIEKEKSEKSEGQLKV